MAKHYVTLGQGHVHSIGGKTLDKDSVVVFEAENARAGREKAFEMFDSKFCFDYHGEEWNPENIKYFPRGYIEV